MGPAREYAHIRNGGFGACAGQNIWSYMRGSRDIESRMSKLADEPGSSVRIQRFRMRVT
ncbi:hypothetical protein AAMO2058_000613400 [Amorphochlora amoebiformis]